MWLMTTDGFFSVVQKPGDGSDFLTIRARCQEDLQRMLKHNLLEKGAYKIVSNQGTDYPYRIRMPRWLVDEIVGHYVKSIDYSNFKDEVTKRRGKKHHDVFSRIWGALLSLEPKKVQQRWESQQTLGDLAGHADEEWWAKQGWAEEETISDDDGIEFRKMSKWDDVVTKVSCPVCSTETHMAIPRDVTEIEDEEEFLTEIEHYRSIVQSECQFTATLSHFGKPKGKRARRKARARG